MERFSQMTRRSIFSKTVEVKQGFFITVHASKEGLCHISVGLGKKPLADSNTRKIPPEVLGHLNSGLSSVLSAVEGNGRHAGTSLVFPEASEFRMNVWKEISKIPYGKTATYSAVAAKVGGKNHRRAVAQALAANVFPILIPCHRVVGNKGLGGYSGGGGVEMKKILLEIESGDAN